MKNSAPPQRSVWLGHTSRQRLQFHGSLSLPARNVHCRQPAPRHAMHVRRHLPTSAQAGGRWHAADGSGPVQGRRLEGRLRITTIQQTTPMARPPLARLRMLLQRPAAHGAAAAAL